MSARRSDGGGAAGGRVEMVDEFACSGMLRNSLTLLHGTVERIFCVIFDIGEDNFSSANTGQIWLKLRGPHNCVQAAKLFLKGVVNQEQQQELSYPNVLHCVFFGARGLFMDSLIRRTSANIVVGSVGFLLISGLTEPVVQAYSLITDLVERCNDTQSRRADVAEKFPGESLESRRAFKALVEKWEDRHILDLLLLPGSVKEILSDLVRESGFDSTPRFPVVAGNEEPRSTMVSADKWDMMADQWVGGMTAGPLKKPATSGLDCFRTLYTTSDSQERVEGAKERLTLPPYILEGQEPLEKVAASSTKVTEPRGEEALQFLLLLKFFTAMGYTEDVVKRVLAQTGPKEASQILDLVQQEQDRSDREMTSLPGQTAQIALSNGPCESEHKDGDVVEGGENTSGEAREVCVEEIQSGAAESVRRFEGEIKAQRQEAEQEEDFVFGVMKKAAASCGYPEQKVAKVYNMLPERSTHQLLLELQRDESQKTDDFREGPREMDDVVLESEEVSFDKAQDKTRDTGLLVHAVRRECPDRGWKEGPTTANQSEPVMLDWTDNAPQFTTNQYQPNPKLFQLPKTQPSHHHFSKVQGPPMPTYPSSLDPPQTSHQPQVRSDPSVNHPKHDFFRAAPQSTSSLKRELGAAAAPYQRGEDSGLVTGEQRFMEGLKKPFKLQLTDKPGDENLRMIIIDGSNVAKSHGLGNFFSCRGIALAVQHFWDRGHRQITTFLPQWRQKYDPKRKEPHYLEELQNVGLVSFTPSREVQGKRICSYDDRFMLQLAQKTDGVIVTNDNLRDLSDESAVWRDIVKKRLLQYTFAGDLFMLPDDPLGRGGPHLHDFLRSDHRNPEPGHHSFAGVATALSPVPPRSQTEVLNYRDRTLGGTQDASRRGSQVKGRERENGWSQHGRFGAVVAAVDRSPEETASLREQLCQVFTGQDNTVALVLQCNPMETDINVLSDLILQQQTD